MASWTFPTPRKLFDYSLVYNWRGWHLLRSFYRQYDLLLRNSLQELKVKLLLSQSQKQNLPSYAKVVIRGVSFFFNKLKFTLGGKSEPTESELRTIALTTPVSEAKRLEAIMPAMNCKYEWLGFEETVEVSEGDYWNSGDNRDRTFKIIYPPLPSAEYVGQKYGLQKSYVSQKPDTQRCSVTVNGCIIVRPSGWNAYRFRRVLSFVIYLYYLNFANMTKAILR